MPAYSLKGDIMSYDHSDLKPLANPHCKKCNGLGRYADYDEDEWGMVMWIKCDCVKRNEARKK